MSKKTCMFLTFMGVCSLQTLVGHQSPDTSVTVRHARRAQMVAFVYKCNAIVVP